MFQRAPAYDMTMTNPEERSPVYQLSLDLAQELFTVVELSATVERFYLRDNLDKQSTLIPVIVARAMSERDMSQRRSQYALAHRTVTECLAILDVLSQRGTVEPEPLDKARATAQVLCNKLERMSDRWREMDYR
jgi:four helix bundle protein